ncbi:hypothetical protein FPRO05_07168 [Fusarium proliferatum]|uniref:Uncharacterized protein n=1 Tax=Gibberella intermedia TaxID=948311 RepID=A0A365MKA4_GIBIN|nr:hypothetical protein FPRO05_07168 [Fusarium proliferatum]
MGPGCNPSQFAPTVPWQPVNEPSNPFSQSHQAPQTQESQNNGGQDWRVRKKTKTSQEVEKISLVQVETDKGSVLDFFNVSKGGGRQENFHYEIEKDGAKYQTIKAVKAKSVGENLKRKFGENTRLNVVAWPTPNISRAQRLRAKAVTLFSEPVDRMSELSVDPFDEVMPDAEPAMTQTRAPAQTEQEVCGMCKKPGHEVIQCWDIGTDGFTHGCAVCNSGEHETDKCQRFPQDVNQRIDIVVKKRACLPPLKTAFWYNMMWKWVKNNPDVAIEHLFPWTTEFAIEALGGDSRGATEDMLRGETILACRHLYLWRIPRQRPGKR